MMKRNPVNGVISILLALVLLTCTLPAMAEGEQIGYVNADTKIYMSASEKGVVDGTATLGTQVRIEEELLADDLGWYRVTILATGKTGWILADDIDLVIAKKAITRTAPSTASGAATQVANEYAFPVLKASGVVDPDTLPGAPNPSQYHLIELNQEDQLVPQIKARLNELGFSGGSNGNKLSNQFTSLIKSFQKKNDMEQDGICSPEFQARLFSKNAKNSKGIVPEPQDPIVITKGQVKTNSKGAGTISFTIQNKTGEKIDAFDFSLRLYSTYGERFLFGSVSDLVTIADELVFLDMSEERKTVSKNGTLQLGLTMGDYYFAGCMVAITAYHTESGKTIHIPDDEYHWYAFGKGVTKGYQPRLVTELTDLENQLADAWDLGVTGVYVDSEIAEFYGSREGLMINAMTEGSPADLAGLQAGDVLLAIGDVRIFGQTSLARAKAAIGDGETVTILFFRNGAVWQTQLTRPSNSMSL